MIKNFKKMHILILALGVIHLSFASDNYMVRCSKEEDSTTCIAKLKGIKEKKSYDLFSMGIGIGNPIANIIITIPYINIDFGYGGFIGPKSNNFENYLNGGIDIIFKKQIGQYMRIGGGIGIGADWSKTSLIPPDKEEETDYERIGAVIRIPFVMEYNFAKNLYIGFKVYPALGPTILLTKPKILFEGIKFNFFGFGFIKFAFN
ncbi:DUF3996 domain-containing protein [Borreliella garinii]|uniref:DUF3996 domain-containing protein n=1 Tax=Borreliella garinii TaxID=29519 RepID=UPI00018E27BF|nr:DUF3996 domain-containing protein [Borreliella garinii]EED30047.1 conserved hypothetical protein [Borreliella garinii Far04]WNZ66627.1 DUF3996 domain-containing protein [Borreliella garinii]WNZ67622.1 DUF3996 domain-containing protein [Borreliella garinii]WNZ68620.1 DUF3996 domain-containing protein [Borreliella garinii]WNZ69620.1 DUF3996 domain-containing protein [Borreliella garinii]